MSALEDAFQRVRASGQPSMLVLSAEPGYGKTRLVQELYRRLAAAHQPAGAYWPPRIVDDAAPGDGFLVLSDSRKKLRPDLRGWRASAGSASWLWVAPDISSRSRYLFLQDALVQLRPHVTTLLARPNQRRQLARLAVKMALAFAPVPDVVELAETLYGLAGDAGGLARPATAPLDPETESQESVAVFLELLRQLHKAHEDVPLVLAIDDAHVLDEASVALVEQLLAEHLPVLVLATTWPHRLAEAQDPFSRLTTGSDRISVQSLNPLDGQAMGDLVRDELPDADPALIAAFIERADGNPYVLGLLLSSPVVHRHRINGSTLRPDDVLELGANLRELLEQHWDHLSEDAQRVLVAAGMLGEVHPQSAVARILDELGPSRIERPVPGEQAWVRPVSLAPGLDEFLEQWRWEVARDRETHLLTRREAIAALLAAVGSIRKQLAEEPVGTVSQRLLAQLHVRLAKRLWLEDAEIDTVAAAHSALQVADRLAAERQRIEAVEHYDLAAQWLQAGVPLNADALVRCQLNGVKAFRLLHGRKEAEPRAREVLELTASTVGLDGPLGVKARMQLARTLRRPSEPGPFSEAVILVAEARRVLDRLVDSDPELERDVMAIEVAIPGNQGRAGAAAAGNERLTAFCERHFGLLDERTLEALSDAGYWHMRNDKPGESVAARRELLRRWREVVGTSESLTLCSAERDLAVSLVFLERPETVEAEQLSARALERWGRVYGLEYEQTQTYRAARSLVLCRLVSYAEGRGTWDGSLAAQAAEALALAAAVVESRQRSGARGIPLMIAHQRYGDALALHHDSRCFDQFEAAERALQGTIGSDWRRRQVKKSQEWARARLGAQPSGLA